MIIVKKHKCILFKLRDPQRITAVIPTAKQFTYKGHELVAVPHRLDEVKVLRNLGFDAPSPIEHHYKWSGRFTPFNAQRDTSGFLTLHDRAFLLSGLGSGKTQSVLWAYDYLRGLGIRKRMLVIGPLSTLERTWGDSIIEHFPHLDFQVLHGSRERRFKLLNEPADIYIVNHDGVEILADEINKRSDIDLVVVDEIAQVARNSNTGRWSALDTVVNCKQVKRWAWGLTGTPTPNAPTDAWAQVKLLLPGAVPKYFNRFRDQVMRQIGQFRWEPRENATEIVRQIMQPAIRYAREDCVDLPPTTFVTREVELTREQKKAYKQMLDKLAAEVSQGQITAVNEAVKMSKLVQICCGVAYSNDGQEITIPNEPRLKEVLSLVQESNSKTIVFVPFVSSVGLVSEYLRNQGFTVECIHGGVSKNERDRIFSAFQRGKDPHVLVAQPAAMSHGLTLTAASTIVWYAPITSNDVYEQATARITRPGQKHNTLIANIEATALERKMYNRLQNKQKMQNLLLDMVRDDRALA